MNEILNQLNEVQREAVLYNDGPSLVIAGAGSGKTRVLTYKVAALLKQGYLPHNILAITFTNKAANEMKQRISNIVGSLEARSIWMGTFHSIFARILRIEADALKFTSDFTIYDTADTKSRLREIIKTLGLDDKKYSVKKVSSRISQLKNSLVTPNGYEKNASMTFFDADMPKFGTIYRMYMNDCHRSNAMDFDDILLYTNVLFRDHPEILAKYQELFQFVLVDEYQDTNFSQHLIVTKLCEKHHKICVVGDDAQSIYSFRGANIKNILQFKDNYPEYKLFKLEQNYRSTQNIVNAANSLISKNPNQIKKQVFSENAQGSKIKVRSAENDTIESMKVCDILRNDLYNFEYQDTAVLYRTKAQSRKLEESFRKAQIPYKIYGGMSFYDHKVVKDILAYFRLIVNHNDEEAFKRAVKYPKKGIGDTSLEKIRKISNEQNVSLWEVISDPLKYNLEISAATIKRISHFREEIEKMSEIYQQSDAYTMAIDVVKKFGILEDLSQDTSEEGKENKKLADEVLVGIHEFVESEEGLEDDETPNLAMYLRTVALLTSMDQGDNGNSNVVTLMTVHCAKGLEFKNVIISGMEEDLFPSSMSQNEGNIEEERRLFYVAITRAEQNCFITYAKERFQNGRTVFPSHSRFLDDIDPRFLELPKDFSVSFLTSTDKDFDFYKFRSSGQSFNSKNIPSYRSHKEEDFIKEEDVPNISPQTKKLKKIQPEASVINENDDMKKSGFSIGNIVFHERFGKGEISQIEAMGGDFKLTIQFEKEGEKKILKKYANLKKLSE